ncbi:MAG: hypothetical protein WBO49_01595 [Candidatus Saccharimonas sp.]
MESPLTSSNEFQSAPQEALTLHSHEVDAALQEALDASRSKDEQSQSLVRNLHAEKLGALTLDAPRVSPVQYETQEVFDATSSEQIKKCGEGVVWLRDHYALAA